MNVDTIVFHRIGTSIRKEKTLKIRRFSLMKSCLTNTKNGEEGDEHKKEICNKKKKQDVNLEGLYCAQLMRSNVVEHIFKWKSNLAEKRRTMESSKRGVCKVCNVSISE